MPTAVSKANTLKANQPCPDAATNSTQKQSPPNAIKKVVYLTG
jgi:hypothetical protein